MFCRTSLLPLIPTLALPRALGHVSIELPPKKQHLEQFPGHLLEVLTPAIVTLSCVY